MRIAVIGSGIAGLGCAWLLDRAHRVTLFEANDYLGGHTHTHAIDLGSERFAVDTGFIVHNAQHYPLLSALFAELGVRTRDTTMSFSVRNERSGLEYNATSFSRLFCQPRNLLSLRFHGMLADIVRFYRSAPALLLDNVPGPTLGEYLAAGDYGEAFRDDHLVPMCAALWSAPPREVLGFPARFLVQFMANHNMLRLGQRAPWRVVAGGSASYVHALAARWHVQVRLRCPVRAVARGAADVSVMTAHGTERFDALVLACHSDQALRLLQDPTDEERAVLGPLTYQDNAVVLHTDASFLPRSRRAWAAWNALVPAQADLPATVSYCMNLLQGIRAPRPLIVTLNPTRPIRPEHRLRELRYSHPLFTPASLIAQAARPRIQGQRRTWYAGAYWGFGFHEDGLRSAVDVASQLGVDWAPATQARHTAARPLGAEALA